MRKLELIDVKAIEMKLPKNFAPNLSCGETSCLLIDHTKKDIKLKFKIEIYKVTDEGEQ